MITESPIYEYKVEIFKFTGTKEIAEELNKLSQDGWELVTVAERRYYFRKLKSSKQIL